MKKIVKELVVIGGGPSGMAAALKAWELGVKKILVIERDDVLGGILPQCIHNGFGVNIFNKELTGPEYSRIFVNRLNKTGVDVMLGTMALQIGQDKTITAVNARDGVVQIKSKAIILSLGCRERTRWQIGIPGDRPAGIFTAGVVQRMVNIEGYLPGKDIVILGSGDIGLIMARRLKIEGCNVKGVYEIMPFSTGLTRNVVQCLEDFKIPLFMKKTVSDIHGKDRISKVKISKVDDNQVLLKSRSEEIRCDTLLLSVGLIPENELSKTAGINIDKKTMGPDVDENLMTSVNGIFSCGNSLFVNDLVDNVTEDSYTAAENAVMNINGKQNNGQLIKVKTGNGINCIIPQHISGKKDVLFRIRVKYPLKDAVLGFKGIDYKKRYRFVTPGELIYVKVKKERFEGLLRNNTEDIQVFLDNGREKG